MTWLLAGAVASVPAAQPTSAPVVFADVSRDAPFSFPRDHGAHPDVRTEWWYVTGWLKTPDGHDLGFQVTFFRSRLPQDSANPSRFAPRQLLFAHAALGDPRTGHLLHDERVSRSGFGLAEAGESDASVVLDGWRFERVATAASPSEQPNADALHFRTRVDAGGFMVDLDLASTGGVVAQGADAARPGWSQKGPSPRDASRYYSVPQLRVTGTVARGAPGHRERVAVTGTAWLDREWSNAYLDPQASGWDWVGLNLDDGGGLMAFRMRDRAGGKLWAGGARRRPDGVVERFGPDDVDFRTDRTWRSAATGTTYPVAQSIRAGTTTIAVVPLMDDQELDSRGSTGTIYWEGAVRAHDGAASGPLVGRGFLEMTGYFSPMRF